MWSVLRDAMNGYHVGCLQNQAARIDRIIERMADGSQVSYDNAALARTSDGRLATYDVVAELSGAAHVVWDGNNKEDAGARGRDFILAKVDVGDLRRLPDFSAQLISAAEAPIG